MSLVLGGLKVLVVEDEYLVARHEGDLLSQCGCVVLGPVPTVAKAMQLAARQRFDVALLDINLANENVFPFAEFLLKQHVPFAFVTGYGPGVLPPHLAGHPLIRKPFSAASLCAAIQAALIGAPETLVQSDS